jgi:GT2 family glycosyltransferase
MSDDPFKPKPDESKSAKRKSASRRARQIEQGKEKLAKANPASSSTNPIVDDPTYGSLREADRVVMRHQIALNLDNFRAAPENFIARPERAYAPLQEATTPFFSVIIPNYNGRRFLPTVLEALRRQTMHDFETIVVDDASGDESVGWIEAHYPEVRLLVNRRNLGFVSSCNLAADAARGRLLVLLNNDTEPEPAWLAELAQAVCANPHAGAFASKLLLFDRREVLHSAGDLMGVDGVPRNRGVWTADRGQFDKALDVFSPTGGAAVFRRELWQALGGFDEEFWMYLEDVDFAFRAQLLGWQTVFVPSARVYHHLSATGAGLASYYVGRNTIWCMAKNMPACLLWRNLPKIVGAQFKIALDALRHLRGREARQRLRGLVAGIQGLPRQLQKRRVIQERRTAADDSIAARLVQSDYR